MDAELNIPALPAVLDYGVKQIKTQVIGSRHRPSRDTHLGYQGRGGNGADKESAATGRRLEPNEAKLEDTKNVWHTPPRARGRCFQRPS
jgi:hypothetical protein